MLACVDLFWVVLTCVYLSLKLHANLISRLSHINLQLHSLINIEHIESPIQYLLRLLVILYRLVNISRQPYFGAFCNSPLLVKFRLRHQCDMKEFLTFDIHVVGGRTPLVTHCQQHVVEVETL